MKWFELPEGMDSISIGQRIYHAFERMVGGETKSMVEVEDHHAEEVANLIPTATPMAPPDDASDEEKGNAVPVDDASLPKTATGEVAPTDNSPEGTTRTGSDEEKGKKEDTVTTKSLPNEV